MREVITILFCILSLTELSGQTEKPKLEISHLTDNFYIFTTYNSFNGNRFPANGMYLVTEEGVVMFDTPWDTTQFQPLLDTIKIRHNKNVFLCIATHSHEDRTGGLEYYKSKGIKTYTTAQTDDISVKHSQKRAEYLIAKDTLFSVGGYKFQTFYGGEGHTPDNIVIWFDSRKILYGGCLIKSTEAKDLGYLGEANLNEWSLTLKKIEEKFSKPKFIVTGHQDWKSIKSLKHTLKLLEEYEQKNNP